MDSIQADKKMKDRICEFEKRLNSIVIPENLHSKEILEISRELDTLILEFYSCSTEEQGKETHNF